MYKGSLFVYFTKLPLGIYIYTCQNASGIDDGQISHFFSYIEGDQCLQEDFVRLLDRLCQSGGLARWGVVM